MVDSDGSSLVNLRTDSAMDDSGFQKIDTSFLSIGDKSPSH